MSVFENFISSITGGDLLGKLIVAIILVCAIAVVSHVLVKWLRHIMQRDDTSIPQSSIFINIMRGIVWRCANILHEDREAGRQHPSWFKQGSGTGRYVASCNHQEPLGRNGNHPQFGNLEECGSAPAATRARVGSLCCNYV